MTKNIIFYGLGIILAIALAIFLGVYTQNNEVIQNIVKSFGYPGLFFFSAISGFDLLVPIPAISFIPVAVVSGLNTWLVIITVSLGMIVGDGAGFLVGRFGRHHFEEKKNSSLVKKAKEIEEKYKISPIILLFLYAAFVPFPNELIVIPFSFLKISWWKVLLPVFFGNLVFNIYLGFGLIELLGFV